MKYLIIMNFVRGMVWHAVFMFCYDLPPRLADRVVSGCYIVIKKYLLSFIL